MRYVVVCGADASASKDCPVRTEALPQAVQRGYNFIYVVRNHLHADHVHAAAGWGTCRMR